MTNVIAWPPVGLTGWDFHTSDPISRSLTVFGGRARTSSRLRRRRLATAMITGVGEDQSGAGYVEMLKRQLAGGQHLVRVECLPALWHLAGAGMDLKNGPLAWVEGATEMVWTAGATEMLFGDGDYALSGEPTTDSGWPALVVTGLPIGVVVARPSQLIKVMNSEGTETSRVLTVARSVAWTDPESGTTTGRSVIRTETAFTLEGMVSIGDRESIVFEALDMPRAMQAPRDPRGYVFTWNFREVFADEYDSWTELDPWR